jgi:hypothetical protein
MKWPFNAASLKKIVLDMRFLKLSLYIWQDYTSKIKDCLYKPLKKTIIWKIKFENLRIKFIVKA